MSELLRFCGDRGLARAHVPGDSVDEGTPFGSLPGDLTWPWPSGRGRRRQPRVAVGPGMTGPRGRRSALTEVADRDPVRGDLVPV